MEDQRSETFRALEVVTLRIGRGFGGEGGVSDARSERSRGGRHSERAARDDRRAPVARGHGHASRGGRHGVCTRENRAIRARACVGCRSAPRTRAGSVRGEGRRPVVEARSGRTHVNTCERAPRHRDFFIEISGFIFSTFLSSRVHVWMLSNAT